jgi:hypothetical protein
MKCGMDIGHAARTSLMKKLHVHAARFVAQTCSADMQRGHAAGACSINKQHGQEQGHAARTCGKDK